MADLLKDLNAEQREAVVHTDGPVMVIAGAGSGKTRVLTYRVAYLLDKGVDPFHILALTFTNKAAKEMKERIIQLIGGGEGQNVWMGTFHSVFARILRIEGHRLGYPSNFTIYDTDDSKRVIKALVKDNNLDEKVYPAGYVLNRISSAKTSLLTAQEYLQNPEIMEYDATAGKPKTGDLFVQYQARLKRASAMDFDDLLFNMNVLLRDFPDVLYKYQQKFHYVLVDEYQDTNYAQYLIVKKLAANNENLCVVGDDAQSIYSFRGANIQNILNFKHDYPDHRVFKLEQNYRSTKTIVAVANHIIANNKNQIHKEIWTENGEGPLITLLRTASDTEEGNLVAQAIFEAKMNNQLPNEAFTILYRTNAQSRSLEEALRRMNIPCRIYGGVSFYQRKEIKDLLAYFRLAINHNDEEALLRVINYPARGLGKTTIEKLIVAADEQKTSIFSMLEDPNAYPLQLNEGTRGKLTTFITMIRSFSAMLENHNAFDLAKHIAVSSGLLKELHEDKSPEGVSRFENIEELLNAIKEFTEGSADALIEHGPEEDVRRETLDVRRETLDVRRETLDVPNDPASSIQDPASSIQHPASSIQDPASSIQDPASSIQHPASSIQHPASGTRTLPAFMQDVALLTDMDSDDETEKDKVTMMTIHSAKGLEFPYIFLVGLEENLFPSIQSLGSRADLEEERRLFYVAVTRARQKLTLSYAENRYRWGNLISSEPSRFIGEIPEQYIETPKRKTPRNDSFSDDDNFSRTLPGFNKPIRNQNPASSIQHPASSIQHPVSKPDLKNFNRLSSTNSLGTVRPEDINSIQAGMEVEHERFGKGKVLNLEGEGPNTKATVFFPGVGQKQLLLRFAKLKIVG